MLMMMDASFNFSILADSLCFHEVADPMGERRGSYSYVSPEGEVVEVREVAAMSVEVAQEVLRIKEHLCIGHQGS